MNIFKQSFNKKMLTFAFLASASFSFSDLSKEAVSACYEDGINSEWKYLEYVFVVQPTNSLNSAAKTVHVTTLTIAAALFLAKDQIYNYLTDYKKVDDKGALKGYPVDGPSAIAAVVLCGAGCYAYVSKLEASIKKQTLINFLNNWSHHRNYIPTELIAAFDELAADFQASTHKNFTNAQVNEIFEIIQHLLEHMFEKRYAKDKKDGDMLGSLKTITEIGKNLSPGK